MSSLNGLMQRQIAPMILQIETATKLAQNFQSLQLAFGGAGMGGGAPFTVLGIRMGAFWQQKIRGPHVTKSDDVKQRRRSVSVRKINWKIRTRGQNKFHGRCVAPTGGAMQSLKTQLFNISRLAAQCRA